MTVESLIEFLKQKEAWLPVYFDGSVRLEHIERIATVDDLRPYPSPEIRKYVMLG